MDWNDYFYYDETSPSCLRWKVKSAKFIRIDDVAGSKKGSRYYTVQFRGHRMLVHRIIWEMHRGNINNDLIIDHIDNNTINNKLSNLQLTTNRENNMKKLPFIRDTSSKYKGVCFAKHTNRWKAYITLDRKGFFLGYYVDEEEAARVYDKKAIELFGEFALTNEKLGLL